MAKVLEKISENTTLRPGDKIEVWGKLKGPKWNWLHGMQLGILENKIQDDPRFKYTGYRYEEDDQIAFIIEVAEPRNDGVYEAGIISGAVILGLLTIAVVGVSGFTIYKVVDKGGEVIESGGGKALAIGGGGLMAATAVVAIFSLLKQVKK